MRYSIVHSGKAIELPRYSFAIDDDIANLTAGINRGGGVRKTCKLMYDFLVELLGSDEVTDLVGAFDDCDPNDLQIVVKEVLSAYAEPLVAYDQDKLDELYNIDKIEQVVDVAERAQTLRA